MIITHSHNNSGVFYCIIDFSELFIAEPAVRWCWQFRPQITSVSPGPGAACKRKEQEQSKLERNQGPKRTRLVFTDLQRRTLMAIFRENHRPAKDLQITISQQLGLELSTVSNFFMNARRRNMSRWADEGRPSSTGSSGSSVSSSAVSCSTA
ncbi:hypothetical protein AGOR_G00209860 [Albula goreensis]|uniref:Homeobox domain-containing protein n=1 Tax=Albula goreensis TaxID=1534307 RepID=A0A8T3CR50_9TELE|nr:hypothetical protein AGOR_G00209860 [Albula goreensis]